MKKSNSISRNFTSKLAGRFYRDGSGLAIKRLAIRKEKEKEKKEDKAIRLSRQVEIHRTKLEEMKKNDELRRAREHRRKKKRMKRLKQLNTAARKIQVYARIWLRLRSIESRKKQENLLRRRESAKIIQNTWRHFSLQREHKAYVARMRVEHRAGLVILNFVRSKLRRKRELEENSSALKIQNAWYQHILRQRRLRHEEQEKRKQEFLIQAMQIHERDVMSSEDLNALYLDDERDTKMHARVSSRLETAKTIGLKRREELYRKCHKRLLSTLKKHDIEHLADTVVSVVPSPMIRTTRKVSSDTWSMKKLSIVRRLLGGGEGGTDHQMDEEEKYDGGPETTTSTEHSPPALSSKAKLAKALMKIGLSSPNSAGLKEVWNAEKRKDTMRRRMRWKQSNNNNQQDC